MSSENQPNNKQYPSAPDMLIDPQKEYSATIKMENGEQFIIKLYADKAPVTVNTFCLRENIRLRFVACCGYFDVPLHRGI